MSFSEKVKREQESDLCDKLNRPFSCRGKWGPFYDDSLGCYYVIYSPFDSSMPYVLTEKQYKSMLVTVESMWGYTFETIYWRRPV